MTTAAPFDPQRDPDFPWTDAEVAAKLRQAPRTWRETLKAMKDAHPAVEFHKGHHRSRLYGPEHWQRIWDNLPCHSGSTSEAIPGTSPALFEDDHYAEAQAFLKTEKPTRKRSASGGKASSSTVVSLATHR